MDTLRSALAAYRNGKFLRGAKLRSYDIFYKYIIGDLIEINGQLMETSAHWPRPRSHLPGVWHEEPAFSTFLENVETGMSVVDLGAGSGWFTLNACDRVRPGGSVTAFEADPDRVQSLKRNIQRNGYENARIVQTRLDEDTPVADHCDDIDFAIVDIEGHELGAIRGLPGLRQRSKPMQILCEVHPKELHGDSQQTLYSLLEENGFNIFYGEMGGSFGQNRDEVADNIHQIFARRHNTTDQTYD